MSTTSNDVVEHPVINSARIAHKIAFITEVVLLVLQSSHTLQYTKLNIFYEFTNFLFETEVGLSVVGVITLIIIVFAVEMFILDAIKRRVINRSDLSNFF